MHRLQVYLAKRKPILFDGEEVALKVIFLGCVSSIDDCPATMLFGLDLIVQDMLRRACLRKCTGHSLQPRAHLF